VSTEKRNSKGSQLEGQLQRLIGDNGAMGDSGCISPPLSSGLLSPTVKVVGFVAILSANNMLDLACEPTTGFDFGVVLDVGFSTLPLEGLLLSDEEIVRSSCDSMAVLLPPSALEGGGVISKW